VKFSKVGSSNWTVAKLIQIILLVVILVLVVYGVANGLTPSFEEISYKFDELMSSFSFWGGTVVEDCYVDEVGGFDGGKYFLKMLGLESEKVNLVVCPSAVCSFEGGGLNLYRFRKGRFESLDNDDWEKYDSVFEGEFDEIERNWEMYSSGVGFLKDAGLREIYDSGVTGSFVLYGDGSGISDGEIFAVWQNGVWTIVVEVPKLSSWGDKWYWQDIKDLEDGWFKEEWGSKPYGGRIKSFKIYRTEDRDEAIDIFVDKVRGGDDDKVYWGELTAGKSVPNYLNWEKPENGIGSLVGLAGGNDEIDRDVDVSNLKIKTKKIVDDLILEAELSDDELVVLEEAVDGKSLGIGRGEFVLKIEDGGDFPIVSFDYLGEKFGFVHYGEAAVNGKFLEVPLNYFPVKLVQFNDGVWAEVGNEEYYRLKKKDFEEVYKASVVASFLEEICK